MKSHIRLMQQSDIDEVAGIHCRAFPTSRSTRLGLRYVRKMFCWFVENQASLCFVGEENGKITGYVVGAIGGYGRKLFRYAYIEVAIGLLLHPELWFKRETFTLWHSYLQAFNPALLLAKKGNPVADPSSARIPIRAALAGIGVEPSARGKGIGKLLVSAFEQAAKEQGARQLGLSVEINNYAARRLYESRDWLLDSFQTDMNSVHYSKVIS